MDCCFYLLVGKLFVQRGRKRGWRHVREEAQEMEERRGKDMRRERNSEKIE